MAEVERIAACAGLEFLPTLGVAPQQPLARQQNRVINAPAGNPDFLNGSGVGPSDSVSGPFANAFDPLTAKGAKVMQAMHETYGSDKKAKSVFYAMKNAGKLHGVD